MYHISVDATRCQGHARCLAFAPETFEFDDEGYAFVPEDRRLQAELSVEIRQAVANCPERAIIVNDDAHATAATQGSPALP